MESQEIRQLASDTILNYPPGELQDVSDVTEESPIDEERINVRYRRISKNVLVLEVSGDVSGHLNPTFYCWTNGRLR